MIKGHSYDKQLYYSIADRLINNLFLNKTNGIINGQGNSCKLSYSSNTVTVADGFFVVQGGITEVVLSETIVVTLNNTYCRLVYELDMSKENTDTEFNQGMFKLITGQNSYPSLTQQELTENDGIYQFEFAQFKASTAGITDFVDKRTYIDYDSIYKFISEQIKDIESGDLYVLKSDFEETKNIVDNLNNGPKISVDSERPTPEEGQTIIWFNPKE